MTRGISALTGLCLAGAIFASLPVMAEELPEIDGQVTFLYYASLKAPARFYGETLGLEMTLDLGWARIYRVSEGASVGIVGEGRGFHPPGKGDEAVMVSIVTPDVAAWFARMRAADVPIETPLQPEAGEAADEGAAPVRSFLVRDPGGYIVEFFEWRE